MLPQPQLVRVFQIASGAADCLALWWVQSTMVIAAGLTVAYILRRRGPSLQSAIYRTTLIAAFVCPIAGALLSAAGIGIPNVAPPHIRAVALDDVVVAISQIRPATPPQPVAPPHEAIAPVAKSGLLSARTDRLPPAFDGDPRFDPRLAHGTVGPTAIPETPPAVEQASAPKPAAPPPVVKPLSLPPLLVHRSVWAVHWLPATAVVAVLAIWLLGTLILATRLAVSLFRLLHLYRTATPSAEDRQQLCRELSRQIGVRPPRLLQSPFVAGPCLAGFFRATILLPEESLDMPLAAVLVHELTHLRRGDCRWNLIRQASLAVLFWQPLVWRLSRRIETVAEEVCDDHVVHWGSDPAVYASGLVRLAEQSTLPISTVVPLVTFRSLLGQRVQRILDSSRRLSLRTGMKAVCAIAVAGLAVTLLVGAFGSDRSTAAESSVSDKPAVKDMSAHKAPDIKDGKAKKSPVATESKVVAGSNDREKEPIRLRGQVLDQRGKPVAGARLFTVSAHIGAPWAHENELRAITDPDGRFDFIAGPRGKFVNSKLLAAFEGYGLAYGDAWDFELDGRDRQIMASSKPPLLRLISDDVPLTGRIISLEGQPIVGATISLCEAWFTEKGSLDDWERAAEAPHADFESLSNLMGLNEEGAQLAIAVPPVKTGVDGRFTLRGIGRERIVRLLVRAPGIESKMIYARTRSGQTIALSEALDRGFANPKHIIYGNNFTHIAAPSRPVVGRVTDLATGKPLAGVTVCSQELSGNSIFGWKQDYIRTATDANGGYRIEGMPLGGDNWLGAYTLAEPYLPIAKRVRVDLGAKPNTLDFQLPRGVWVEGRVTDKETDKPIGGSIQYFLLTSNPLLKKLGRIEDVDLRDYRITNDDGRFRIAALPGRGIVAVKAFDSLKYTACGVGADTIAGGSSSSGMLSFDTEPFICYAESYSALAGIEPSEKAATVGVDFKLTSSGPRFSGRLIDANGNPVTDAVYSGRLERDVEWRKTNGGTFEVWAYDPARPRRLVFYDAKQNQAALCILSGPPPKSLVVQLQPAGSVRGRIVDEHGTPFGRVQLYRGHRPPNETLGLSLADLPLPIPSRDMSHMGYNGPWTDEEGRFEVHGLVPGHQYAIEVYKPSTNAIIGVFPEAFSVRAGETKDLGDLVPADKFDIGRAVEAEMKVKSLAASAARSAIGVHKDSIPLIMTNPTEAPAATALPSKSEKNNSIAPSNSSASPLGKSAELSAGAPLEIRGLVLHPDGKPAVGAHVVLVGRLKQASRTLDFDSDNAITIGTGKCDSAGRFAIPAPEVSSARYFSVELLARAPGGALAWQPVNPDDLATEHNIKLRDAAPVRGRLVTTEGQPAAGVHLQLTSVFIRKSSDLEMSDGTFNDGPNFPPDIWATGITTDAGGWYSIPGVATGAAVSLRVDQEPYAPEWFPLDPTASESKRTHVLAPAQIVKGIVVAGDTGKPIAGALVHVDQGFDLNSHGMMGAERRADSQGRFRVNPYGAKSYDVAAFSPAHSPYLATEIHFEWSDTEREHEMRIVLPRGVLVSGTITDAASGKPIPNAAVRYTARNKNHFAANIPLGGIYQPTEISDARGQFSIAVPAGPGHLTVRASPDYVLEYLDHSQITKGKPGGALLPVNADAPLDLAAAARESTVNFKLRRGVTIAGQVVRADGTRSERVIMQHRGTTWSEEGFRADSAEILPGGRFEIHGVSPDLETPVFFLDPDAKQGTIFLARAADADKPLIVTLGQCGSLALRYLDPDGKPVAGFEPEVFISFVPGKGRTKWFSTPGLDRESTFINNFDRVNCAEMSTDGAGRVTFSALIPGATYGLLEIADHSLALSTANIRDIVVKPGERIELPDITLRNPKVLHWAEENRMKKDKERAATAGVSAMATPPKSGQASAAQPKMTIASPAGNSSADLAANDQLHIHGQVLDPSGKPVAGAKLFTVGWRNGPTPERELKPWATTDAGGRFAFDVDPAGSMIYFDLLASADGYGVAFGPLRDFDASGNARKMIAAAHPNMPPIAPAPAVLRLVADDVPLTGRVVDIQGVPIAGARLRVKELQSNKKEKLDAWEKAAKQPKADSYSVRNAMSNLINGLQLGATIPEVVTDRDGRFTVRGIGRERVVQLIVSGPGIETKLVWARTRRGERIVVPDEWKAKVTMLAGTNMRDVVYFPADFTVAAAPSRPVGGRITDADSGKPLAGVIVSAGQTATFTMSGKPFIRATTDANGRYQLDGLEIGRRETISVFPPADSAYVPDGASVTLKPNGAATVRDFQLHRGIWVRGKVIDERTGKPLSGALQYFAYLDNPNLKSTFHGFLHSGLHYERRAEDDGRFAIAVPPGKGVLAFMADDHEHFRRGIGIEQLTEKPVIPRLYEAAPYYLMPWNFHIVREINLPADSQPIEISLALRSGIDVAGKIVDFDGKPVSGALVSGEQPAYARWDETRGNQFVVMSYDHANPRRLVFYERQRNLVAVELLSGEPPTPLVVRLRQGGSVRGRLIDAHGRPIAGALLVGDEFPLAPSDVSRALGPTTDDLGRFEIHGLIPGQQYSPRIDTRIYVDRDRYFPKSFTVAAGETKDLGDVTAIVESKNRVAANNESPASANPPPKIAKQPTASNAAVSTTATAENNSDKVLKIRGSVVDPSGKPVAGADVFVVHWRSGAAEPTKPKPLFTTGADGQFQFRANVFDPKTGSGDYPLDAEIVATADRFGLALGFLADFDTSGNAERLKAAETSSRRSRRISDKSRTLHLVADDVPLTGRIISIEGRPVAGARVALSELWLNKDGNLDAWESGAKLPHADYLSLRTRLGYVINTDSLPGIVPTVMTDSNGRFTMHGLGRERLATLLISGPGIETKFFEVRTRRGATIIIKRNNENDDNKEILATDFVHVAGPSNAVIGRVTDRATGKPLAGVTVLSQMLQGNPIHGWGQDFIRTTTDIDGRYRLEGMPVGNGNEIGAFTLTEPYIPLSKPVRINLDARPVTLDFKMPRGVWAEGQVSDELTHSPIPSSVEYFPLQSNPFYKQLGYVGHVDMREFQHSTADGRFRIAVLLGPGIVTVSADEFEKYPLRGLGREKVPGYNAKSEFFQTAPYLLIPENCSALTAVDPAADAKVVKLSFALPTGGRIVGHVVDATGKPIFGSSVCGKEELDYWSATEADSFTVVAYKPDKPRRLIFYEPKKNLAAVFVLSGAPAKPPVVRLTPAGAATGRLLDEFGRPIVQARIGCFIRPAGAKITRPTNEEGFPLAPANENQFGPVTDDDGRFDIRGLIPGQTFNFSAYKNSRFVGRFPEPVTARAGETKNLGDVVAKSDYYTEGTTTGSHRDATANSSTKPAANAVKSANAPPTSPGMTRGNLIQIRGQVVDPSGKPVAGAIVRGTLFVHRPRGGSGWHDATPPMETRSDSAGRFTLECRKSELAPDESNFRTSIVVAASLPDNRFGPEWTDYDPRKPHDLTLKLVPDEPIEGHIIDLEGKPVAGAEVSAWISKNSENDLSKWLAALKLGMPLRQSEAAGNPDDTYRTDDRFETMTDSAGRFKLVGIGRERLARITVSARGFVSGDFSVVTRPMDRIKADEFGHVSFRPLARTEFIYGSHFTAVLDPEQTIEGYVRDAITGKPIAGVNLSGFGKSDYSVGPDNYDTSDSKGHFRIHALHAGDEYELTAESPRQPYLSERVAVPKAHGLGTIKFDLVLHRGVPIHGRITDKQTGQPVRDAEVRYLPSRKNPHLVELRNQGVMFRERSQAITDDDGRFTLTGIPGPGLIEVSEFNEQFSQMRTRRRIRRGLPEAGSAEQSYPLGQGFSEIANLNEFVPRPQRDALAVKQIQIGENEAEAKCEIQLQPAKPLELKLVDPQGHPLDGVEVCGAGEASRFFNVQGSAGAATKVLGLGPDEQRTVMFRQPERKLGRVVVVSWKTFGAGPATITLEPCATIKLRLVDAEHQPQRGSQVDFVPTPDYETRGTEFFQTAPTDADGRLVYSTLAPGETYTVASEHDGALGDNLLIEKLAVEPGQTIDLGELNVSIAKRRTMRRMNMAPKAVTKAATKAAAVANKPAPTKPEADEPLHVRGRVVDPNGKPVAGAEVSIVESYYPGISRRVVTTKADSAGAFQLQFRKSQFNSIAHEHWRDSDIVATGPNDLKLGPDWRTLDSAKLGEEITLQLRPDDPVGGTIVDLQGRPVAGATVVVYQWACGVGAGMPTAFDPRWKVVTGPDGRFEFSGLGRRRQFTVDVIGPGIVADYFQLVTTSRDDAAKVGLADEVHTGYSRKIKKFFGTGIRLTMEPSQVVEGVVRDAKTGQPMPHVLVAAAQLAGWIPGQIVVGETTSDNQGHYRLDGMPKGVGNKVCASPPAGLPYFAQEIAVPTAPGFAPVKFDLLMHRGIFIRGRLTDKATGEPIPKTDILYVPWPNNSQARALPEFNHGHTLVDEMHETDRDGRFAIVGLPGHGLLEVVGAPRPFLVGQGFHEIANMPSFYEFLRVAGNFAPNKDFTVAVKELQIADGATDAATDMQLDSGKTIALNIVDPAGKPLSVVRGVGIAPGSEERWPHHHGPTVQIQALRPNENRLVILHEESRNLGKAIRVNWNRDGAGPITVKLEPCGRLKARLLDSHGNPIKFGLIMFDAGSTDVSLPEFQTDADGRIDYGGIPPGATFEVTERKNRISVPVTVIDKLSVWPGETVDLGEFDVTTEKNRPKPIRTGEASASGRSVTQKVAQPPAYDKKVAPTAIMAKSK